jgi:hypothetical protein
VRTCVFVCVCVCVCVCALTQGTQSRGGWGDVVTVLDETRGLPTRGFFLKKGEQKVPRVESRVLEGGV